ncbi:MAG: sugar ABC transporter permease [Clostridia bacterium]|nr:sugar ABC transporter permease [Clostridia bacterium]
MRKKRSGLNNENRLGLFFMLPSLVGFLAFTLIPVLLSVGISFTSWDIISGIGNITWIGMDNYAQMLRDSYFIKSLQNNLYYTAVFVPATMALALLLALGLKRRPYGQNALKALFFIPYITNIVVVSIIWMAMLQPYSGPVNKALSALGVAKPPMWLTKRVSAMPSIILVNVWFNVGYAMIIFLAGLQSIPGELYEAAEMDGAGPFRRFVNVTLPLLSPTTFFILVTTMINSFKVFGTVNIMTQGGPSGDATTVLVFHIYRSAFRYYKMGYASAMSIVLFLMIFIVTMIQWQGQKKWVGYSL